MGYGEKRGKFFRARWRGPTGDLESMSGFLTKKAADTYANDQEAAIRAGRYVDPRAGQITLLDWVNIWYPAQDLELTTLETYRSLLENIVLPEFGERSLASLAAEEIAAWEKDLVSSKRCSARTAKDARSVLGTALGAAIPARIQVNPAERKRATGKKATRRVQRVMQARKAWATPLEALLMAERVAAMSGEENDFIKVVFIAYTGVRWSEAVGLDPNCVHGDTIDLDWKLYELNGRFYRGHPKDGSIRPIDAPPFLSALLGRQEVRTCTCRTDAEEPYCSGGRYVFLGPGGGHARRSDFARRFFRPAADGWYAARGGKSARVAAPVLADAATSWPGRVINPPWPAGVDSYPRGRGVPLLAADVPVANWLPIMKDLTPHGLRHSHETWMAEDRIADALRDERMGHIGDGSMRAHYTHVSDQMRGELVDALQKRWEQSLADRAALERHWDQRVPSSVPLLNELLEPFRDGVVTAIGSARPRRALQPVRRERVRMASARR
jgi:integrase